MDKKMTVKKFFTDSKVKVVGGLTSLIAMSGVVAAAYNNPTIEIIGNLSKDFGKLFGEDMPDLVIGALVLGLIIFLGVILKKIMHKSTT